MDPKLYRAAESGNWEVIKEFADHFESQQTPKGNTVLHVLAQSFDSSDVAKQILAKTPHLALKTNDFLETPLHMAARHGYSQVVRALIDHAKGNEFERLEDMLGSRNKNGNTALHEAVRNNCYEVVKKLVEEAPNFGYNENFDGETPLYLAVEKANVKIADLILTTCTSPSYLGPGKKTALHIAAARNFQGCMNMILEKQPNLLKEVDRRGWTALHYAAEFNHKEVLKYLLNTDKSLAYVTARNDESKTALHVAVAHGHLEIIKEILLHCPDCWEMTTSNFRNMLHLAANGEQKEVLEFILKNRWASELINQKDAYWETPLRQDTATKELEEFNLRNAFDNASLTPADVMAQEGDKVTEREMETDMVVATLIVTVTFAAGFTIPGGYDASKGNEGMAILSKKAAFTAFVISDSLALLASVTSVFLQFVVKNKVPLLPMSEQLRNAMPSLPMPDLKYAMGYQISIAMVLMVIAFLTGLYAVLPNKAIKAYLIAYGSVTCFPICLYGVALCVVFIRQVNHVTSGFIRQVNHVTSEILNSINRARSR